MYFQISVTEEHCLLRYLQCRDGNILDELIVYEMCMYVFCGASSRTCSNYALKRTAIENEYIYRKEAAETLKNKFNVDDLLKSVENEDNAIHLIKKRRSMCLEGEFNLTNFAATVKGFYCQSLKNTEKLV